MYPEGFRGMTFMILPESCLPVRIKEIEKQSSRPKILVVDDSSFVREEMKVLLGNDYSDYAAYKTMRFVSRCIRCIIYLPFCL